MKLNEKKHLLLNGVKILEEFIENYFQIIEMSIKLGEFEILENFLNYYFTNSPLMTVIFLSSIFDILEKEN